MSLPRPSAAVPSRSTASEAAGAPTALLSELAEHLGTATRRGEATVTGICVDSRRARKGDLFLARVGAQTDGHLHALEAFRNGAGALVVERFLDLPVPQLRVPSVAAAAGPLAAFLYGYPSERLAVIGVTGTNGKTTTCQLLRGSLVGLGGLAGQIGTTGAFLGDRPLATTSPLSTPEAPELQRHFHAMEAAGAKGVAIEVTSHGLDRGRVDGTRFQVGVFLNLSAEHLDYHGSMDRYFAAKARLFEPDRCGQAVVCVDDEWGRRLAASCPIPVTTFGAHPGADLRLTCRSRGLAGIVVELSGPAGTVTLESPLVGSVNASNVAAAYLAARAVGVPGPDAEAAIARCPPPPGRFEVLTAEEPYLAVVDYAHTPDALEALVATARELARGRVHLVLGARGERYRAKRPAMAAAASRADRVLLTTDSPGVEDPQGIVEEMLAGVPPARASAVTVELDRRLAIQKAVDRLEPGDVLLLTGRGHETTQRFGASVVAFDDRVAVRLALAARAERRRPSMSEAVTVVIPAHDAEDCLGEAIASALGQTRPPAEVIVVDDGSSDGTSEVARSFGPAVQVVSQPCLGPSSARNAGVSLATSPLVAFLDADDLWHEEKLALQVEALEASEAVLCAADWTRDPPLGPVAPGILSAVTTDDLLVLNRFQTSTVLLRRQAFALAGGFSSRLDGAEDWDLWIRLSRLGPVLKLDVPLVCYRDRPEGFSKDLRRHHEAALEIVRRELRDLYAPGAHSTLRPAEVRAWHHLRFAVAFARLGDRRRARACLSMLRAEHLLAAALPASTNLLLPFLARRAGRRLVTSHADRGRAPGSNGSWPDGPQGA